jgi:hypothetical protein
MNAFHVAYCSMPLPLALTFVVSTSSSCIHTYLFLRTIPNVVIRACSHCHQPRSCPNCKHAVLPPDGVPRWKLYRDPEVPPHRIGSLSSHDQLELIVHDGHGRSRSGGDTCAGNRELYHHHPSLANYQAELAAARESSEFQTSGCNTPRQSAETLNSSSSSRDSYDAGFDETGRFSSLV